MPTRKGEKDKKAKPHVKVEDLEPTAGKTSSQTGDERSSPRGGVAVRGWDPNPKKEITDR